MKKRVWTSPKRAISIRLDPNVYNELMKLSFKRKISLNKLIESLLVQTLF